MANVTYTGASSTSPLLVSSSGGGSGGISSPCDPREPPPGAPPLPGGGGMGGIGMGGYDLMTYQRLASALYAHHPPTLDPTGPTGAPTIPTALLPHNDPLLHGAGLDLKESLGGLGGAFPYPMYPYPYDLAGYSFTHGYGMAFDAARRKNATRETTSTLKAWLNEHKKNPYPTKGEKIMLAIITKMTLTQVSTWFANARRRLKKENKMTWEPRNKGDEDDEDDDKDYDVSNTDDMDNHVDVNGDDLGRPGSPLRPPSPSSTTGAGGEGGPPTAAHPASPFKPRIWSLADMASSSSGPTSPSSTLTAAASASAAVGKMSLYRPLHLEVSPYARPLPMSPRMPSPQEALLQVYAKSLGLAPPHGHAFPVLHPHTFNGLGATLSPPRLTEAPLPPSLQLYSSALTAGPTSIISRPVATRPVPPLSPGSRSSPLQQHTLPGGAKITPAPHPTPGHRPEG